MESPVVGFDYKHGNHLKYEGVSYQDLNRFLFDSFKLGKVESGWSVNKLSVYDLFVVGNPADNAIFTYGEISSIKNYVNEGGGLLVVGKADMDYHDSPNLNDIIEQFGFVFNDDSFESKSVSVMPHYVTDGLEGLALSACCSVKVLSEGVKVLASIDDKPVAVALDYGRGRVVGVGSSMLFSSFNQSFGFNGSSNRDFISKIFNYLLKPGEESFDSRIISLPYELSGWIDGVVKDDQWRNFSDLLITGLGYFKEHYAQFKEERQAAIIAAKKEAEALVAAKRAAEEAERREEYLKVEAERKKVAEEEFLNTKIDGNGATVKDAIIMGELSEMFKKLENKKEKD